MPVVWHHATPHPYDGVLGRGPLGVDLFFVISGFLITTLLLEESRRTGTIALGSFYLRRSLRIFPLYYLVLSLFVLHALFVREHGPVREHFLRSLPAYATYTSNWFTDYDVPHSVVFSFSWSLATEEQFYLVWPCVLLLVARSRAPLVWATLFMMLLCVVDQAVERGWTGPYLALTPLAARMLRSISTPICLGSLLAIGLRAPRLGVLLDVLLVRRMSAPMALLALVLAAILGWPLLHAHLAMVALVGACVVRDDHGLRWGLERRAVAWVGVVSYGIYLVNVPVVVATGRLLGGESANVVLVFLIGLAGSVAVASVAHRWVERPFVRLRDRLRSATIERA